MEKTFENLAVHFGNDLAARIYGCAIIMRDNSSKLDGATDEEAIRFTIGALKRRRIQGGKKVLTWLEAVEKLELEQDEDRHYGMVQYVDRDIKRIEAINRNDYVDSNGATVATGKHAREEAEARAANMMAQALQVQHDRYNADPVEALAVKEWVSQYMANISRTKLSFIRKVMADIQAGKGISRNDAQNIRLHYVPKGVQADDFMELIARYA
jgi:hypothetical protein